MTQVSLSTSTNYNGPLNALVEDEGTILEIRFDLDQPAPAGGLKVYIDSELEQSLNRLDLLSVSPENINRGSLASGINNDASGIAVEISPGATFATLTVPVFNDPEPARSLPSTFEGLNEVTFRLRTREQVSASELSEIEGNGNPVSNYTINSSASSSVVLFADTADQLPSTSTPTPTVNTVSISATPTDLVEEDGTLTTLTINLSEPPPEGGVNVTIDSDVPRSLAQFDVGAAIYNGARLAGVADDSSGFTVNVTEQTATIQLAPFDDDVDEGPINITYTLQASDDYTINSAASSVSINIEDNDASEDNNASGPVVSFSVAPTTVNEAQGTELVMSFSVDGDIPPEGITVKLEGDAARIMRQFTAAQTRFNDDGRILYRFDKGLVRDNVVGGTLELFSLEDGDPSDTESNEAVAGDAFLSDFTFTITEPTASITIPVINDLFEEEDTTYTYTLVDGDGYQVSNTANSATFTVTDGVAGGGGPTVGVSATSTELVESEQTALTLNFTTTGDIPPEGVVVVLEGPPRSISEFDVNATNPRLPESETVVQGPVVTGGSIVGTNEVVGGLLFRITDPAASITVPVFQDGVEEGLEKFTFDLKDGELYNVDSTASSVSFTIEDVPRPVVSFSVTPTTINEAEGTELVMNFSVDGDIPAEGITVKLEGDAARIMRQFTAAQTRFNDDGGILYRFDKGLVRDNVVGGTLNLFSLEDGDPSETASDEAAAGDAFLSDFTFTITEPTASITIPVINDLFEEEDTTYTYTLVADDTYKVDDTANSATFTVTDGVVGGGGPTVGVSAAPTTLVESDQTALTLTFTTAGDIPPEGVVVVLEGPPRSISEFDVNATNPRLPENETVVQGPVVSGGSIVGTNEVVGGLLFRITDPTATITVPVFQDDVEEGLENFTFNLKDGELYNVDANASSVSVAIADTPVVSFSVTPTTVNEAEGTELVMNFSVDGDIPPEGITVKLEGDAARIMRQFTAAQTRFNDDGGILYRFDKGLVRDNVVGGTLNLFSLEDGDPSETASDEAAAGDAFLSDFTFTITEPTASITIPVINDLLEEEDTTYTYTLVDGDGYTVNDTASSATFTVTDGVVGGGGPTVGVSAAPTALVESDQTALTLTFTTEGDIPPEGVVVVLEGPPRSISEFDVNATNPRLPESETVVQGPVVTGGSIVGTNEVVGGLLFRITEPTATLTVPVFQDEMLEGTENFTFNLKDGELYNVDANASSVSVAIEDGSAGAQAVQVNDNNELTGFAYKIAGVAAGEEARASISEDVLELSDAAFDNLVGFYEVVDENGGIDIDGDGVADFNPGDDGYAKAALENALDGFALRVGGDTANDTRASEFDAVVQGGKFYAPFAIANAGDMTVADFLAANPDNDAATSVDDQVAYFAFGEANPDGAIHLQSRGNGIYGFEDLPDNLGISDNDFNDAVFKFNFTA